MWLSLAGIIALVVTIGFSIRATSAAVRSADLAEKAIVISQRIGEAQTRAYVSISKAQVAIVPHDGANYGNHPLVQMEARNSGNSPARNFRWNAKTVYLYVNSEGIVYGNSGFAPDAWGTDIASQGILPVSSHQLPSYLRAADQAAFEGGTLHMIVTIAITFKDVFEGEINAEYYYAAFFPTGDLSVFVPLRKWPTGAEETAFLTTEGRRMAATQAQQANQTA